MGNNIILVGFMGAGKTTIGRALAERLGLTFADTDDVVEELAGMTIPEIFTAEGEGRFREIERSAVALVADRSGQVVSTGGGAVLSERNREALERAGMTVALTASPKTLVARLGASGSADRPLLAGDASARIEQLLAQRAALYAKARHAVSTDDRPVAEVVEEIVRLWEAYKAAGERAGPASSAPR
jgi:shikimate kinase